MILRNKLEVSINLVVAKEENIKKEEEGHIKNERNVMSNKSFKYFFRQDEE